MVHIMCNYHGEQGVHPGWTVTGEEDGWPQQMDTDNAPRGERYQKIGSVAVCGAGTSSERLTRRGFVRGLVLGGAVTKGIDWLFSGDDAPQRRPAGGGDGAERSSEEDASPIEKYQEFIDTYRDAAKEVEKQYGVPYAVSLAMGILESGFGGSELAKDAYNFHGMKANEEWGGKVCRKKTEEHIAAKNLEEYLRRNDGKVVSSEPIADGAFHKVKIQAEFKAFPDARAGFLGFGEHLRTRLGGKAYEDAFAHTDPRKFVAALFDDQGSKWATDTRYMEKVTSVLDEVLRRELPDEAVEQLGDRSWDELSKIEQGQFGGGEKGRANFEASMRQMREAQPNRAGYEAFVASIVDISDAVRRLDPDGKVFPTVDKAKLHAKPRFVLHYTAWPKGAWGHDGTKFAKSVINNKQSNNITASANYYLGRDGKRLEILTQPGAAAHHAGTREYNNSTTGLEMPALVQQDITPEMYEGAIYAVVWQYLRDHQGKVPTKKEMRRYVIGHGEIAELHPDVTNHRDFPRVMADAVADRAYELIKQIA